MRDQGLSKSMTRELSPNVGDDCGQDRLPNAQGKGSHLGEEGPSQLPEKRRTVKPKLALGGAFKYMMHSLGDYQSTGFGFDLGAHSAIPRTLGRQPARRRAPHHEPVGTPTPGPRARPGFRSTDGQVASEADTILPPTTCTRDRFRDSKIFHRYHTQLRYHRLP